MAAPDRFALHTDWWMKAVIYQVYIRSFTDADGDGIGDIAGIRTRLPYLRALGVDAIWINPWYRSPMVDAGYDVSDYRDIDPLFGTLDEAIELIGSAHDAGLRVMVDVVPNHTSDQHPWFRAALAATPGSPERARFIFREGRGPGGDEPPNDWLSAFGGPAWTRLANDDGSPGQWYLHLFTPEQPDLDWTSQEVRDELVSVLDFWLARGVDGFRIDVAHGMVKEPTLPDVGYARLGDLPYGIAEAHDVLDHPHWDREELHDIYRDWHRLCERYPHVTFVGEIVLKDIARTARYTRPDELHSAFNFPFLRAGWDAQALREVITTTIEAFSAVGAISTWVLGNHDVTRVATRYGGDDVALGVRRSMAAHLLMLGLPGGAYIYQGDELGLSEITDIAPDARQDPIFTRSDGAVIGRDGCRIPVPWTEHGATFGFSPDPASAEPWLPLPADWGSLSVERQEQDPASPLTFIRDVLSIRASHPGFADASFEWRPSGPQVLHFARAHGVGVIVNLGEEPVAMPEHTQILVTSQPIVDGALPPDAACWYATG